MSEDIYSPTSPKFLSPIFGISGEIDSCVKVGFINEKYSSIDFYVLYLKEQRMGIFF